MFHALLVPLDDAGHGGSLDHIVFLVTHPVHPAHYLFGTEDAHQVVFQRYVELTASRIALTAGAAAQLAVNPARFVAFCTNDGQTTRGLHFVADLDIRTATRHVRSDGHGSGAAGFRNNLRFALVLFRVQYVVSDIPQLQHAAEQFTHFHGSGTYQHRTAFSHQLLHMVNHRVELHAAGFVYQVFFVFADDRTVGGNHHHIQLVDIPQFLGFRFGRTGHTGQLVVHAEIVLQGHGGVSLRSRFHLNVFLGFDGLVQSVAVTAAFEDTTGLFIHDFHLVVLDDIIHVAFEDRVGFKQLAHGVDAVALGSVFAHQVVFAVALFVVVGGGALNFRDFRTDIGQEEELAVFSGYRDELNAFFGQFNGVVLFIDNEEKLGIDLVHFLLLILQVMTFCFVQDGVNAGFADELDEGFVARHTPVGTQQEHAAFLFIGFTFGNEALGFIQSEVGVFLLLFHQALDAGFER